MVKKATRQKREEKYQSTYEISYFVLLHDVKVKVSHNRPKWPKGFLVG
jgi:hypothetical protein